MNYNNQSSYIKPKTILLSATEYLELIQDKSVKIKSRKIIPPNLDNNFDGGIEVEFDNSKINYESEKELNYAF